MSSLACYTKKNTTLWRKCTSGHIPTITVSHCDSHASTEPSGATKNYLLFIWFQSLLAFEKIHKIYGIACNYDKNLLPFQKQLYFLQLIVEKMSTYSFSQYLYSSYRILLFCALLTLTFFLLLLFWVNMKSIREDQEKYQSSVSVSYSYISLLKYIFNITVNIKLH